MPNDHSEGHLDDIQIAEIRRWFTVVRCILMAAEARCCAPDRSETFEDYVDEFGRGTGIDREVAAPYLGLTLREIAEWRPPA